MTSSRLPDQFLEPGLASLEQSQGDQQVMTRLEEGVDLRIDLTSVSRGPERHAGRG